MTTSQYGVDLWPYAWESQQSVGSLNRMIAWNEEAQRELGWSKVYGVGAGDGSRDLCVVDRRSVAQLIDANALLTTIGAALAQLPAAGTSLVTLLDETLTLTAGNTIASSWFDTDLYPVLNVFLHNTGANPTDAFGHLFASGAAGAGITAGEYGVWSMALAGGATNWFDMIGGTVTVNRQSAARQWLAVRSAQFRARSPLGTTLRVVVIGRKPWARE